MCCIFTYVKFINTHLGHDPWECSHSSGALSGDRDTGGDGTQVPGGDTSWTERQKVVG